MRMSQPTEDNLRDYTVHFDNIDRNRKHRMAFQNVSLMEVDFVQFENHFSELILHFHVE